MRSFPSKAFTASYQGRSNVLITDVIVGQAFVRAACAGEGASRINIWGNLRLFFKQKRRPNSRLKLTWRKAATQLKQLNGRR